MIRDCAGLEDSSDSLSEDDSAGPGDDGSSFSMGAGAPASGVDGLAIGRVFILWRPCVLGDDGLTSVFSLNDPAMLPAPPAWTPVPDDEFQKGCGREAPRIVFPDAVLIFGVPGALPSFLAIAESFRMESADGALA